MDSKKLRFIVGSLIMILLISLGAPGCAKKDSVPSKDKTKQSAETEYPTKPIEIVVPFTAGGGADMVARATADYMSKKWGKPVLVVNKPGGAAVPGTRYALKEAPPDGYTVLLDVHTSSSMMIGAMKNPPVTLADRKYAGRIILDPFVFAVKADAPWKDFKEFSEWVKTHPEELVWGTVGPAGPSRYAAYDWLKQIGVDPGKTKMVITEGGADSLTKLAGGHIKLAIHTVAETYALAESKKIKVLAVLSEKRSPYMPDVPTAEEQGVIKGVGVRWWAGIALPSGTPDQIVKKWESAIADMVKDQEFLSKAKSLHLNVDYLNSAEMKSFVEKEAAYYTDFAAKIGIRN